MECKIDGCIRKHEARGLCKVHYNRAVRKGEIVTDINRSKVGRPRKYTDEERKEIAREKARVRYDKKPKRIKNNRTEHPCYVYWINAKQRAKALNLDFDLELTDLIIPESCPLLGIPLIKGKGWYSDNSPTLDRIIPQLGYIKSNIWIISMRANRLKSDASLEELKLISSNLELKQNNLSIDKK